MRRLKKTLCILLLGLSIGILGVSANGYAAPDNTSVQKIKLTYDTKIMYPKNSMTIKAKVTPSKATNKSVKWSSSNKKVAVVSKKGVVTAKKAGTATITCKAKDGSGVNAKVKISVKKFTPRTKRPGAGSKYYYSNTNIYYRYNNYGPTGKTFDGKNYCIGNCTWYACGRAGEILGKAKKNVNLDIFGPNPYGIWQNNKTKKTFKTGKKPQIGALVVFGQRYGSYHIAVVEKIENGVVYVSESGYKTSLKAPTAKNVVFHYGPLEEWNRGREIIGYIYLL